MIYSFHVFLFTKWCFNPNVQNLSFGHFRKNSTISLIAEIHLFSIPLNPKVLNNPDPGLVIWVLTITLRKRQISPNGLWLPGPLAQSVEQRTFNPWVVGSIPTGPTTVNSHQIKEPTNVFKSRMWDLQESHLVWLRRAHRRSPRRCGWSRPLLLLIAHCTHLACFSS